jgi:nitrate reductase gamma subunit
MIKLLDGLAQYFAQRKGLLPLVGCLLVLANFVLGLLAPQAWSAQTNLLLHLGIVMAVLGLLLARVL